MNWNVFRNQKNSCEFIGESQLSLFGVGSSVCWGFSWNNNQETKELNNLRKKNYLLSAIKDIIFPSFCWWLTFFYVMLCCWRFGRVPFVCFVYMLLCIFWCTFICRNSLCPFLLLLLLSYSCDMYGSNKSTLYAIGDIGIESHTSTSNKSVFVILPLIVMWCTGGIFGSGIFSRQLGTLLSA